MKDEYDLGMKDEYDLGMKDEYDVGLKDEYGTDDYTETTQVPLSR